MSNGFFTMMQKRKKGSAVKAESENPYLNARRSWNEHVGTLLEQKQGWQLAGGLALLIALACVGGLIHIGSQSKFIPYVVEVDKLGQTVAAGPVDAATKNDPRILNATISQFIQDARMVTPDVALQRKAVFEIYAHLVPNDPATQKMNDWLNGSEESSPFKRAENEMVSIEITSVLQQTQNTWQVDWNEITRDRQGVIKDQPVAMRALITVYTIPPTSDTTEDQIRSNPVGIYIKDFSWLKVGTSVPVQSNGAVPGTVMPPTSSAVNAQSAN